MKICKYLAALLPALAMVFSFSSCSKEVDPDVDEKANYTFIFKIDPGSLSEEQLQTLNDSIDSKIYGSVGAPHNALYSTKEYAVKSYTLATASDDFMLDEIVNPIADEFNVLDFAINLSVNDEDGNEIIGGKKYAPTVTRKNYSPSFAIDKAGLSDAAVSDINAKLAQIYAGEYPINVTEGYAKKQILSVPADQVKAYVNSVADVQKVDSFGVSVSVVTSEGTVVSGGTKSYEPIYTFKKCYEIVPGALTAAAVEELKSEINSALFNAPTIPEVTEDNKTKSKQIIDYGIQVAGRKGTIKVAMYEIANKYSVFDFKVIAKLVNREGVVAGDTYEFTVNKEDFDTKEFVMKAEITRGTLSDEKYNALTDSIQSKYLGGSDKKVLGQLTVSGAPGLFESYFDQSTLYWTSPTAYTSSTLKKWFLQYDRTAGIISEGGGVIINLVDPDGNIVASRDLSVR